MRPLRARAIQHPWIGYCFTHVLETAHPGDESFDAHPEAAMRHSTESSQIQIPFEGFARKIVFSQPFFEERQVVDALAAANNLTVSFGSNDVEPQSDLRPLLVGLEVERLDGSR